MLMSHRRRLKSEDDGTYFAAQTPLTGQRGGTAAVTCILLRLIKYFALQLLFSGFICFFFLVFFLTDVMCSPLSPMQSTNTSIRSVRP